MMRSIAILGSTGSIGTQALDICRRHPDRYKVTALTARGSKEKLFEQVREFRPEIAGLTEGFDPAEIPADLKFCRFLAGKEALHAAAAESDADMVLVSIVGIAGLQGCRSTSCSGDQSLINRRVDIDVLHSLDRSTVTDIGCTLCLVNDHVYCAACGCSCLGSAYAGGNQGQIHLGICRHISLACGIDGDVLAQCALRLVLCRDDIDGAGAGKLGLAACSDGGCNGKELNIGINIRLLGEITECGNLGAVSCGGLYHVLIA